MLVDVLLPALAFGTFLAVIGFAVWSRKKTIERKNDPDAPRSTLAADAESRGRPADV